VTPPRQVWLFQVGCWATFAVAVLQLAAHLAAPGALPPHAEAGLSLMPPAYVFEVPGTRQPTYRGVTAGLSISLPVLLVTLGAAGLAVIRHGRDQAALVRGVAGALAAGLALLLVTSIVLFFSAVTFALAVPAMCFGLAAVPES
jgi:hypothetical protein